MSNFYKLDKINLTMLFKSIWKAKILPPPGELEGAIL